VVVDHIEDYGNSVLVGGFDEFLEGHGPTIIFLNGKDVRRIVPPGKSASELRRGHYLNGIDPQLCQMRKYPDGTIEIARGATRKVTKSPDMHLVDNHLVPGRGLVTLLLPNKGGPYNYGIAYGISYVSGIGINPTELLGAIPYDIFVLIPLCHPWNIH
jgi:hypothetical protein